MRPELAELLHRLAENSKDRGWFFLNTQHLREIEAMRELAVLGRIQISEQDVRIDHTTGRVKAGEFVGVVVPSSQV